MHTATQVTIVLPNIPSSLAKVGDLLRSANVNILAISCREGQPETAIHLVVDDPETAKIVLKPLGKVTLTEVLAFLVKNKPGAIASIGRAFAGAGINIQTIYATATGKEAMAYVAVDDPKSAIAALKPWTSGMAK